jgi:hypothetical protein
MTFATGEQMHLVASLARGGFAAIGLTNDPLLNTPGQRVLKSHIANIAAIESTMKNDPKAYRTNGFLKLNRCAEKIGCVIRS